MSNVAVRGRGRNERSTSQGIIVEFSKLGTDAAERATREWGQHPRSTITHLVVSTPSRRVVPGSDYHIGILLSLPLSVQHVSYHRGYFDGSNVLRLFNEYSENTRNAPVLVVCSEIIPATTSGPSRPTQEHRLTTRVLPRVIDEHQPIATTRPSEAIVSNSRSREIVPDHQHRAIAGSRHLGAIVANHVQRAIPELQVQDLQIHIHGDVHIHLHEATERIRVGGTARGSRRHSS